MHVKNFLFGLVAIVFAFMFQDAQACRGPFPKSISIEEAFHKAEAVFLGKVVEIKEGFPADFKPGDPNEFKERQQNLSRQNNGDGKIGRTIVFEPINIWKGDKLSTIILVEPYALKSCEWNYDVQPNDEFIVFASRYGNYLTFPAVGFDGKSGYTKHNPSKRIYSDYQKEHYAENIRDEQKNFDQILSALPPQ